MVASDALVDCFKLKSMQNQPMMNRISNLYTGKTQSARAAIAKAEPTDAYFWQCRRLDSI